MPSLPRTRIPRLPIVFFALLPLAACGGGEPVDGSASEPAASATSASGPATDPEPAAPAEVSAGSISFQVDGEFKTFDHLPASSNSYMKVASAIRAHPAAGATEQLTISFMSIDLKAHDYPAELPAPAEPSDTNPFAGTGAVGLSYTNPEGVEWAGPARLAIDGFGNDGVLQGSFEDVSLPHTENELENLVLTDGYFNVRIAQPW